MEEIFSFSIGVGSDLPIFSGATNLCETHEKMETLAGYCVWIDDFMPLSCPQRSLIKSLLWHLHTEGVSCTISGLFPSYLSGRFKELLIADLYIAKQIQSNLILSG
jgi:hypothetical protein